MAGDYLHLYYANSLAFGNGKGNVNECDTTQSTLCIIRTALLLHIWVWGVYKAQICTCRLALVCVLPHRYQHFVDCALVCER